MENERVEPRDLQALGERVEALAEHLARREELVVGDLLHRPRRLIYVNFVAGLARGLGMAVGFTVLGALVLYILRLLVVLNLPGISSFIATIVRLVRQEL
ncbi:MAG: DUF5665 domain-containing protein [Clostridia bacterium]|nr:DUF5665 domain-containing protein [Clostridia bacterium]